MIKEKFISAIIGTLFFAVFQPFGISLFSMSERFLIACGLLVVAFFEIDPTLVRAGYAILTCFSAAFPGILLYILLCFIMPKSEVE